MAAAPAKRPRKMQNPDGTWSDTYRVVPRSKLVEHYFSYAGAINRHNRQRMDSLRIEHTLEFKQWWLRCNTSFIGVVVVDAVNAWNFEQEFLPDAEAYAKLATELIWNGARGAPSTKTPAKYGSGINRQFWLAGTPTTVKLKCDGDTHSPFAEDD